MSNHYYITEIEVKNLWHQFSLKTTLKKDLNLFIGINGSGKTTLINIIKGVLKLDLPLLYNIDFDKVSIKLQNAQKHSKTISLEKKEKYNFRFKVSNKTYEFHFNPEREYWLKYDKKFGFGNFYNNRNFEELRESLRSIFSIRSISVYRQLDTESNMFFEEDEYNKKVKNPIDKKMEDLEQKFIKYKGLINLEINKISENFRKNVFREILTTESAVNITKTLTQMDNMGIDEIKRALSNLGLSEKKDKLIIENFLNKQKNINPNKKDKKAQEEFLIFMFVVYNLDKIIKLSNDMESSKKILEEPIDKFISITNSFLKSSKFNKQIYVEHNSLKIKNKNSDIVELKALSSGEKQLLILLMETLLQKQDSTIYIIDEPELSLHVAWQRALVGSILDLNPNIQLIIATHSPEIVANYKPNIIRMELIVK